MDVYFQHGKTRGSRAQRRDAETGAEPPRLVRLMSSGEGLPAPIIYRKGWALLGYLAVESNRMHSRASLAELFWPNLDETSALTNLRQVLSNLNRFCKPVLGEEVLRIERTAVGLIRSEQLLFDIDLLQVAPCRSLHLLTEQRVFLEGLEDIAGIGFRSWLEIIRQELGERLVAAAEKCCDDLLASRQWERAAKIAHSLGQHDPWNEANARRMMLIHAGSGRRGAAVATYRRIEKTLHAELGVEPAAETRQLLERICRLDAFPGSSSLASWIPAATLRKTGLEEVLL